MVFERKKNFLSTETLVWMKIFSFFATKTFHRLPLISMDGALIAIDKSVVFIDIEVMAGLVKPGLSKPACQTRLVKPGLSNPACQTRLVKPGLTNPACQTRLVKLGLSNPACQTRLSNPACQTRLVKPGLSKPACQTRLVKKNKKVAKNLNEIGFCMDADDEIFLNS